MLWLAVALFVLALSVLPNLMIGLNLPLFRLTKEDHEALDDDTARYQVSLLIPARDEAAGIRDSILTALKSKHVDIEVVVMDDGSTDGTDTIVQEMASVDPRVIYVRGTELPSGWNGKQHACWQLAKRATHDRIVFIDADVRLLPDGLARLCRRQDRTAVALLSAFPHQVTGTFWEKLLIPMMHFILLGFLPFRRMRDSAHPAYAAGCGQLFMTTKSDYQTAGTHAAIRGSRHDGVKLPRAFRSAGLMTDVVDGTQLAECRMYTTAGEVVRGVLKNATEGIANPKLIIPFSVFLIGGSVMPAVVLFVQLYGGTASTNFWAPFLCSCLAVLAFTFSLLPRATLAKTLRQSWIGVILHPLAVLVFIVLQWIALVNHITGRQVAWRGRTES